MIIDRNYADIPTNATTMYDDLVSKLTIIV